MAGSRGHIPHVDVQEGRSGSDCLEKAAQGGSHPAGGPSPLGIGPVGSAGLDSKCEAVGEPGPQGELAFLEWGTEGEERMGRNRQSLDELGGLKELGIKEKGLGG